MFPPFPLLYLYVFVFHALAIGHFLIFVEGVAVKDEKISNIESRVFNLEDVGEFNKKTR